MATHNFEDPFVHEDSEEDNLNDYESDEESHAGISETLRHKYKKTVGDSESEDEFEKEMTSELDGHMASKLYTFHSSQNEMKKLQDAENAALFYDPKMDDEDQAWVNEKRESYRSSDPNRVTSSTHGKPIKEKKSDAVLNCPACMCTVCLDCQRHELYHTQYRAMFTLNTVVNYGETLQFKKKQPSNLKNKRKRKHGAKAQPITEPTDYNNLVAVDPESNSAEMSEADLYHPVNCSNCKTRIAVYDSEEIYHFYNVISSYS